jgi:hypothetical protein
MFQTSYLHLSMNNVYNIFVSLAMIEWLDSTNLQREFTQD